VAADLTRIHQSSTADEAETHLGELEAKWDNDYLPIGQSWRRTWAMATPFFDFPPEIHKVIHTTNAIESVNMSLRKITKSRESFPCDVALLKLFYLALRNISKKWTMPIRDWKAALARFTISYEDRFHQQHPQSRLHKILHTLMDNAIKQDGWLILQGTAAPQAVSSHPMSLYFSRGKHALFHPE
jgi:hypothetical protein